MFRRVVLCGPPAQPPAGVYGLAECALELREVLWGYVETGIEMWVALEGR